MKILSVLRYLGTTPTAGFVLTSDAAGNASWAAPTAAGNILDGGSASSVYAGGPVFDLGHAS